ncbi:MAG: PLP-dependent aminotransferase family protein [Chthoniobacterales bacterium]|nr:PLP-dependent aminotransferase family protein [Chthoniobacterales bacterium]
MHSRHSGQLLDGEPLYTSIASNLGELISNGALRPGDRMPSVRTASRQNRVSVTTAVQAYLTLENKGLIEARPRSGFFVRYSPRQVLSVPLLSKPSERSSPKEPRPLLNQVFDAINARDVVQLGAGSPSVELLPVQKLNRMLSSAARRHGAAALEYDMPPGSPVLRRALARRAMDWGLTVSPDEIITTNGGMEALVLSLRAVTKPGDTVAVESPTYFGVLQAIEQLGLKVVEVATDPGYGICFDSLERALRKRRVSACLVIPNFNNPIGSLMPDNRKERLVAMLAARDIPLIEDDLYGDLYFRGSRPQVAKAYDRKGTVILCGSFSKTLAPGYRVGWMIPGRFFEKAKILKSTSTGATATLPQLALADYVANGGYDHHLRGLRQALKRQVEQVSQAVSESFPPETKLTRPAGGFVLWVELPRKVDALELHARALESKISIAPGPMFSSHQDYPNFIRLSCGQPWSPKLERAIGILSSLVKQAL